MDILKGLESAYIEAIYFTDTGDTDQPGGDAELSESARRIISKDIKAFWDQCSGFDYLASITYDQIAHDFWFTRNGHGVGFWGKPESYGQALADKLTDIAESFGESYTYETEAGEIGLD